MTRLPFESRQILPRPDLPPYELNDVCPITGERHGLENHHIVRRSFGPGFKESWWVELPDGTVVGNRIMLSPDAHRLITDNEARIIYLHGVFEWIGESGAFSLMWQPPKISKSVGYEGIASQGEEESGPKLADPSHLPLEGSECPTCHRRVPHKKKKSSPKTKTFAFRVPTDEAVSFDELVDAAAEHHGLKSKPHYKYWTALLGITLLLQAAKGELPHA